MSTTPSGWSAAISRAEPLDDRGELRPLEQRGRDGSTPRVSR